MRWIARVAVVALVLVAAIVVAPAFFMPVGERLAIVGSPADVGLRFENVAFQPPDRPLTIRGWWMPADGQKAAIILVHGGGPDNRTIPYSDGLKLARDLVQRRYGVLALDLRNYGESDASPEGISFGDAEANDIIGAMNYLRTRAPDARFGALGMSMGGETVLYAAARDTRLEAAITDGTFTDARSVAAAFSSAATGLPRLAAEAFVWSAASFHGVALERGRAIDVAPAIAPRPVLVIHNDGDPIVPTEHARRLAAAIPGSELWLLPAPPPTHPLLASQGPWGTHTQNYKLGPEAYVARVTAFLDPVFARAAPPAR